MVCEDCHKDEGPQWALAAWRDLFGVGRPPLAALEILRRVERSLVEPPSVPGMPRMPSAKPVSPEAVFEAVRAMESTHRPAIVRALSALVLVLPKVQIPEVPADIALRLGVWAKSLDLQVRAASIATCLFLTPYEPKLSHIAKRGLVATTAEDQEALRRHIVFNLLAILYSVEGGNMGAVTLARRAIEEYGVVLADDENPIASALAASYASAGEQRTAMKWALRSLNGQSFKGVTYPLDSTGTRADTLSRAAHLLGKGGSNRGAIDRYQEALKVNPRHAAAQEALCVELIKGGRKGEAIECIDRYLIIKPDFVQGYFIKAKLYEEMGKVRAAIKSVVRGLKIDPDNQTARSNLRRLQGRR